MMGEHEVDHTEPAEPGHDIGAAGTVVIETVRDDVLVRGVDGTRAAIRGAFDPRRTAIERSPGRFVVRRSRGAVTATLVLGRRIGAIGGGKSGSIEVDVPRDARLEISTATGDVSVRDLRGGVRVRTVSGDLSLTACRGEFAFNGASGDLHVDADGAVRLRAETINGDVAISAPRLLATAIRTISGDVHVAAGFDATGEHGLETTSGDVVIAPVGGLVLDARSVSGDIHVDRSLRTGGWDHAGPIVVGDGGARVSVRALSGDIAVRPARPSSSDSRPPVAPAPTRASANVSEPVPAPKPGATPDHTLALLEAVARGEVGVEEAERQLRVGAATRAAETAEKAGARSND
jgi:hypothetical protein